MAVQLVNHHIEHGLDRLQDVASINDRKMIKVLRQSRGYHAMTSMSPS